MPLYTGIILTSPEDFDMIRLYIGISRGDPDNPSLSDDDIQTPALLGMAEIRVIQMVEAQVVATGGAVPAIDQILNAGGIFTILPNFITIGGGGSGPAVASDLVALKAAVAYYVAALYMPGSKVNINTSVTEGDLTQDIGGLGSEYREIRKLDLDDCDAALKRITNWQIWPGI